MLWAQALFAVWLLHVVAGCSRPVAALLSLLVFVPIGDGNSLATAMRGLWGDPSVGSMQMMFFALVGIKNLAWRQDWRIPALVALGGLALYASALGPWDIDLYRAGYQPVGLVAVLGGVAMIAWWRESPVYLWLLVIDLLVWHGGWVESTNLWDILIDPLLVLAMLALAARNGYRAHQNRKIPVTTS